MWGSFLAFAAEPRIKTNFYSSSVASYCSFVSLAWKSTFVDGGVFYKALIYADNLASYS
jgi:hypothetical protein